MTMAKEKIGIIPLGAYEYHGQHLPFETDAIIAEAFAQHLAQHCDIKNRLTAFPVETIGYSIEHMDEAKTQSLKFDDAIHQWINLGLKHFDNGYKKLLFLNAHGGNSALLNIVITELRCRLPILAVATSWGRFGLPDGLIDDNERHLDIHAGFIETSLMLFLAKNKVDMTKAENFYNHQDDFIKKFHYLSAYGPQAFGWKMCDLNKKGAAGNASKATYEAGKKIFDHAIEGFQLLLSDMAQFDLHHFDEHHSIN
ncbi:creatininase family protein [Bartonella tamiae]|uniref:Creatinine amidohydrolase n=1 Tax=Bartonella tamiae Th239 TaxID=1094558 RepID=J0QTY6_9HYPH|nr:creatininase family protein [Bartonella tamiae]EJF89371.1 hypothetical protein ME5_01922 [Bartonella tamiae Th239]EJF92764.1 hypothetical protein MEG_01934 [Bartonella tamiae Th307]